MKNVIWPLLISSIFFFTIYFKRQEIRFFYLKIKIEKSRNFHQIPERLDNSNFHIIGNSLVADWCPKGLPINTEKLGFRGELIDGVNHVLNYFDDDENIVLWIGLNNILNGQSFDETQFEMSNLIKGQQTKIKAIISLPEIHLERDGFFVSNKKCNPKILELNTWLRTNSEIYNYELIDLENIFGDSLSYFQTDGIHLNCKAYMRLKKEIEKNINV